MQSIRCSKQSCGPLRLSDESGRRRQPCQAETLTAAITEILQQLQPLSEIVCCPPRIAAERGHLSEIVKNLGEQMRHALRLADTQGQRQRLLVQRRRPVVVARAARQLATGVRRSGG